MSKQDKINELQKLQELGYWRLTDLLCHCYNQFDKHGIDDAKARFLTAQYEKTLYALGEKAREIWPNFPSPEIPTLDQARFTILGPDHENEWK